MGMKDTTFNRIRKELIDEMTACQEYSRKGIAKLRAITDPKKFCKEYMKFVDITEWDMPDELLQYID